MGSLSVQISYLPLTSIYLFENFLFLLQRFLSCTPEEAEMDLEGEKTALFSKEITVSLKQWIFPEYVSLLI